MHRIQRDIPAVSFYKYHPTTGQHTTPGDTKKMEKKAMCTVCYIFRIALLVLLFLRVVGERGGFLPPLGQIPLSHLLRSLVYLTRTFASSLSLSYFGTML